MAPLDMGLLLPSIAHLLAAWPCVEKRFHAQLERLDPRLRYLLPRALPRYLRLAFHRLFRERVLATNPGQGLPRLGRCLRARGYDPSDMNTLGAALFATLDELMGERLPHEAREEWVKLYRAVLPALAGAPRSS
ncbi:MAG: hypothetical protein L0210_15765 [Rhodospirillales bacterium]|nr:hypothetical protein [Rhodospirillales bacterium]